MKETDIIERICEQVYHKKTGEVGIIYDYCEMYSKNEPTYMVWFKDYVEEVRGSYLIKYIPPAEKSL